MKDNERFRVGEIVLQEIDQVSPEQKELILEKIQENGGLPFN